jgi:hypothetical protein
MVAAFGSALVGESTQLAYTAMSNGGGFQGDFPNPATPGCGNMCNRMTSNHYASGAPAWTAGVLASLEAQMVPGDVLAIVTAEWKFPHTDYIDTQEAFLRTVAQMVQRTSTKLLLVADVPYIQERGENCLTPATVANCETNRSEAVWYNWPLHRRRANAMALHLAVDAMHARIAAEYSSVVSYLPPSWMFDRLCTSTTCSATIPGTSTISYHDQNHLSTAGSLYLGPHLNCFMHDNNLI